MALVQIRLKCERVFRDCLERCWGCKDAQVVEVKNLSGKPPREVIEERLKGRPEGSRERPSRPEFPKNTVATEAEREKRDVRRDVRSLGNTPRWTGRR